MIIDTFINKQLTTCIYIQYLINQNMASRTYFSSTSNLMQCNCVKKGSSNQCVFHSNGKSIHVAGSTSVVGDTNVFFFFRVSRTTGDHSCHKEQRMQEYRIYLPSLSGEITFLITAGKLTRWSWVYIPSSVRALMHYG